MPEPIRSEHFETAIELLEAISLRGPFFGGEKADEWIFRGHSKSDYQLLPSAHRVGDESRLAMLAHSTSGSEMDVGSQIGRIFAEFMFLNAFWETADKYGLPIPEYSQKWRREWSELGQQINSCYADPARHVSATPWPLEQHFSLMALAQHYGVPTRLLDWTRSPLAAVYFAASPPPGKHPSGLTANVWALNPALARSPRIETVLSPRAANPNLHAQDGLFTIVTNLGVPVSPGGRFSPLPVDECVRNIAKLIGWKSGKPAMYRFSFPRSIAGEVLWWLARERMTAAALFPGYEGVARAILESPALTAPKSQIGGKRTLPGVSDDRKNSRRNQKH